MKEEVIKITFYPEPDIRIRVINFEDTDVVIKDKKKYPFILYEETSVYIETSKRNFHFSIYANYVWNGADIPRFLWRLIGSRTDNEFLLASMVHDYMLSFKNELLENTLHQEISIEEYRRLTSLIFRQIMKQNGIKTVKANIMSWFVDIFQKFQRSWKNA